MMSDKMWHYIYNFTYSRKIDVLELSYFLPANGTLFVLLTGDDVGTILAKADVTARLQGNLPHVPKTD